MRLPETVLDREQAKFITTLVHDEWLETVIAGHNEPYEEWTRFAAQLVLQVCLPEQRNGNVAQS